MLVAAVLLSSSLGVSYAKTDEICQQAETESEKQTESQKETESEKQSESQKETESEKQSESQKETESEKQSESQKESESEKETETNPGGENLPAERSTDKRCQSGFQQYLECDRTAKKRIICSMVLYSNLLSECVCLL